jgi:hypothetical protein
MRNVVVMQKAVAMQNAVVFRLRRSEAGASREGEGC